MKKVIITAFIVFVEVVDLFALSLPAVIDRPEGPRLLKFMQRAFEEKRGSVNEPPLSGKGENLVQAIRLKEYPLKVSWQEDLKFSFQHQFTDNPYLNVEVYIGDQKEVKPLSEITEEQKERLFAVLRSSIAPRRFLVHKQDQNWNNIKGLVKVYIGLQGNITGGVLLPGSSRPGAESTEGSIHDIVFNLEDLVDLVAVPNNAILLRKVCRGH